MPAAQSQRPGSPMQAPQEDPGRRSARHRSHSPRRCRRRDPVRSPRAHGCRGRRSSPCRGSRRQCSWSPPDGGQERSRSHSCRRHRRNRVAPLSTWPPVPGSVEEKRVVAALLLSGSSGARGGAGDAGGPHRCCQSACSSCPSSYGIGEGRRGSRSDSEPAVWSEPTELRSASGSVCSPRRRGRRS